MEFVGIGFLSLILILSALREFKPLGKYLRRFPTFMQFVPSWSFFAPIPNMHDYHLLYRGIARDKIAEEWKFAYKIPVKRPKYCFLWNPEKRFLKGLLDIVHDLMRFSNKIGEKNQICSSLPYLHLLNFVNSLHFEEKIEKIQFVIVAKSDFQKSEVVFLSEPHPLARR